MKPMNLFRGRRPAVLAGATSAALVVLLASGLLVARAVDGVSAPAADASASPAAGGNGGTNVAVAQNGTDGRTVYAIRLKIVQTARDTVDATNAAVAVASCTDCSTVAISFEGVLVVGSPSDFQPTNLALAYNQNCYGCSTFADAYQQVVQRSTRVRITGAGRQKLAAIRRDLESLRTSGLSFEEVIARVKADEQAFADVLLNDCVPVGHVTTAADPSAPDVSDSPAADLAPTTAAPDASSSPSPSTAPSTDPAMSPSPTDSPSASPSPTASP